MVLDPVASAPGTDTLRDFARHFAHQSQDVSFRIFEIRQPEIVSRHRRDQVWFDYELDAARVKGFVDALDVLDLVVNDRSRMLEVGTIRNTQHEANAPAIKESHVWRRLEQKRHPKHVSIESNRAIQVFDVDEDLADLIQRRADGDRISH